MDWRLHGPNRDTGLRKSEEDKNSVPNLAPCFHSDPRENKNRIMK